MLERGLANLFVHRRVFFPMGLEASLSEIAASDRKNAAGNITCLVRR
jgi:hypothetical protein